MYLLWTVLYALGSLLFLVVVFRPLEVLFPARPGQPLLRPAWRLDLCFFAGQYLLWSGLVLGVLLQFRTWLDGIVPHTFRSAVAAQPCLAANHLGAELAQHASDGRSGSAGRQLDHPNPL